jgi:hypothetical protein
MPPIAVQPAADDGRVKPSRLYRVSRRSQVNVEPLSFQRLAHRARDAFRAAALRSARHEHPQ